MKNNPSVRAILHDNLDEIAQFDLLCQLLNPKNTPTGLIEKFSRLDESAWTNLYDFSKKQGVSLILANRLQTLVEPLQIPEKIQNKLHQAVLQIATRNVIMLHEAGLIFKALKRIGIKVIALKGLFLIEAVYANISMRQFADLDLMVRREDVDVVIACLKKLGYSMSTYYSSQDANLDIKHVPPMHKPAGPFVEIHWTILEENEPFEIDIAGMWQRAIPVKIAGLDVLALGIEDLILHLCLHLGYQHHFDLGLRGLYDIVTVLAHYEGKINWSQLGLTASQWGVERVAGLVLKLAKDLLGANIDEASINQMLVENIPDQLLVDARTLLLQAGEQRVGMTPDLARLGQDSNIFRKAKIIGERVFIPRQSLARLYNISPRSPLIFVYYLKRFLDLRRTYGHNVGKFFLPRQEIQQKIEGEMLIGTTRLWMRK